MPAVDSQGLSSGIAELDFLLNGGLPPRQTVVIAGLPGCGKTVLAAQIAANQAARGVPVVIATLTSEPHTKLLDALKGFSWFDRQRVGKEILLVSAYPWVRKGVKDARDVLVESVREKKAKLLVIDGMSALRDLWRDDSKVRDFLSELGVGIASLDCVGLITSEGSLPRLMEMPEATAVDGIIALSVAPAGMARPRRIEVVKLRGRDHLRGEHPMRIDGGGVRIVPRLETIARPTPGWQPSEGKADFGVPELDAMLGGGLPAGSSTLLAGGAGSGKTLLAASFLAAGARAGEAGVFLSFNEPEQLLWARTAGVGIDLGKLCRDRRCDVVYRPAVELDPDEAIAELLARVKAIGARRVVVDGIGDLERALRPAERRRDFFNALSIALRERNVTPVFTVEASAASLEGIELSGSDRGALAENMLAMRLSAEGGRLRQLVSVVKVRAGAHDASLLELSFAPRGISLRPLVADEAGARRKAGT